jgi:endonuclease YncB( thermonuclease family)
MVGIYQILLPLLSLFLVRVDLTDLWPLDIPVEILRVYDGDTILAGHGTYKFKVRLTPIDAPEKGQPTYHGNQDAGALAKRCLIRQAPKRGLLTVHGLDLYRRLLGDIDELSLASIRAGCATLYPYARFSSKKEKTLFLRALQRAKDNKKGLWRYGGFLQPMLWRKLSKRSSPQRSRR